MNAATMLRFQAFDRRAELAIAIEPGLAKAAERLAAYEDRLVVLLRSLA